jgi:hypothetical protein
MVMHLGFSGLGDTTTMIQDIIVSEKIESFKQLLSDNSALGLSFKSLTLRTGMKNFNIKDVKKFTRKCGVSLKIKRKRDKIHDGGDGEKKNHYILSPL